MKRKMSLIIFLLFIMALILSTSIAASDTLTIDASITSSIKASAAEWYGSSQTRALLTVSLSADTIPHLENSDSDSYTGFWLNPSWVGISKSKQTLLVAGYYSNAKSTTILMIIYYPNTGKIQYLPAISTPPMTNANAEMLCESIIADNKDTLAYERNDPTAILAVLASFQ